MLHPVIRQVDGGNPGAVRGFRDKGIDIMKFSFGQFNIHASQKIDYICHGFPVKGYIIIDGDIQIGGQCLHIAIGS